MRGHIARQLLQVRHRMSKHTSHNGLVRRDRRSTDLCAALGNAIPQMEPSHVEKLKSSLREEHSRCIQLTLRRYCGAAVAGWSGPGIGDSIPKDLLGRNDTHQRLV